MMDDVLRSTVPRNIDQGDTVMGVQFVDLALVFIVFQVVELVAGLPAAAVVCAVTYFVMLAVGRRQAAGFLPHAGRWLVESRIFVAFAGLSEEGERVDGVKSRLVARAQPTPALRRD